MIKYIKKPICEELEQKQSIEEKTGQQKSQCRGMKTLVPQHGEQCMNKDEFLESLMSCHGRHYLKKGQKSEDLVIQHHNGNNSMFCSEIGRAHV